MRTQDNAAVGPCSHDHLRRHAQERGAARAIGCDGRWLTFAQWLERSERLAERLAALGEAGQPVGLRFAPAEAVEFAVAWVACHLAGCTAVPLSSRLPDGERAAQLREAGVRLVLSVAGEEQVAAAGGPALRDGVGRPLAAVLFTSGTTQAPKGVLVNHRALERSARACAELIYTGRREHGWEEAAERPLDADDTIVTTFPVYSSMSLQGVVNVGLHSGAAQHFLPAFDGATFSARMRELEATVLVAPPAVMALWRQAEPDAVAQARCHVLAGAPMSTDLAAWAVAMCGENSHLVSWYGLTEGGGTMVALDRELADHVGAIGRPIPGEVCRVLDGDGAEAQAGELVFALRPGETMEGYLNRPDLTAATMGADGWFRTGDLVAVEDGVICLRGRRQEWINRGANKIYPAEIEDVAARVDGVVEAVALGIPHEVLGEDVALCVQVDPGSDADEIVAAIRALLAEEVADYKRPRRIRCTDALPRNANGKVVRAQLREQLR